MLLKGCQGLAGAWQPGARWPLLATAAPALKQSTTYPIGLTLLSIQEQNLLFLAALTAAGVMCPVNQQVAAELSAASDCSQGPLEPHSDGLYPGCRPPSTPVTALTTHRNITVFDQGFCSLFCHPLPTAGTAGTIEVPAKDQE